jgi:hypothetical protein
VRLFYSSVVGSPSGCTTSTSQRARRATPSLTVPPESRSSKPLARSDHDQVSMGPLRDLDNLRRRLSDQACELVLYPSVVEKRVDVLAVLPPERLVGLGVEVGGMAVEVRPDADRSRRLRR